MAGFTDTLDLFWKLQARDAVIVASQREIAKQRAEIERAQSRVSAAATQLKKCDDELGKLRAAERDDEAEIERLESRIKNLEAQSGNATSEAQLINVTSALEKERVHLDEIETRGLERLEVIEAAEVRCAKLQLTLKQTEAERDKISTQSQGVIAAQEKVIAEQMAARNQLTPGLGETVLEQYEVANRQNPGMAICYVKPGECLGCSGELTQQHVSEVRARNQIVKCPHCRRIQDWRV